MSKLRNQKASETVATLHSEGDSIMNIAKIAAVLATGFVSAVCLQAPAHAASPMTETFLANVGENAAFLEGASRIAADRAASAGIRDFARSEVPEASALGIALADATPPTPEAADALLTGRSVALDGPPTAEDPDKADLQQAQVDDAARRTAASQAASGRAPLGQTEIVELHALHGAAFDALYRDTQRDALRQVESDYRDYIAHGDDPALVALAKRELPNLMKRLATLTKA